MGFKDVEDSTSLFQLEKIWQKKLFISKSTKSHVLKELNILICKLLKKTKNAERDMLKNVQKNTCSFV